MNLRRKTKNALTGILIAGVIVSTAACGTASENRVAVNDVFLNDYRNMEITTTLKEATEDDVKEELEHIAKDYNYVVPIDKAVSSDSTVDISLTKKNADGSIDEASTLTATIVLGNDSVPAELEEAVIGLSKGETKEFESTDSSGEKTPYVVEVVTVYEYGEITDDIAGGLGIDGVTDLESLKKYLIDALNRDNKDIYKNELKTEISNTLYNNCKVNNIQEHLKNEYYDILYKQLTDLVEYYSDTSEEEVTLYDLVSPTMEKEGYVGTTEDYIAYCAERNAKLYLIYKAIAEKESISVDDIDAYSLAATDWASQTSEYDTLKDFISDNSFESYERDALADAVMDYLVNLYAGDIFKDDSSDAPGEISQDENSLDEALEEASNELSFEEKTEETQPEEVSGAAASSQTSN
ncbi:trigger factor C-terminal domain-containing protein (plasmid) [Butyrivibrio proteoclasticus B316]|uniref:Trigger factor C-terminal domain-containing protein n=2 Tax=Butyrivibrio proteoclasticus TaxID=43305 RepID=E0S4H8_BUTPB|nr:trigger factor C-terminal domain-containing protein [Butyrivibrio proteoclasticus B316]